jgi:hypothetical protein
MSMRTLLTIVMAAFGALCAAAADTTVSVSDGFPDQSAYAMTSASSTTPLSAFDSFVHAKGASSTTLASFHSFVSMKSAAAGLLEKFNSSKPVGLCIIIH